MQIMVQAEFKADKKEPLGVLARRVVAAFEAAGLEPSIAVAFCDGPLPGGVSAVDRALRKQPDLTTFVRTGAMGRCLTNEGSEADFSLASILALADGVPRSLPFHAINIRFGDPDFGVLDTKRAAGILTPLTGVAVADSWWVNGRNRLLVARYVVEAGEGAKTPPPAPLIVAAVLAAFGNPKKIVRVMPPVMRSELGVNLPAASAASGIFARYRARLPEIMARLDLPHDGPPPSETGFLLDGRGPLKPTLEAAFAPRGYDCRGGQGIFTLRRRTARGHVVDLVLDVGTWSRLLTAMYVIQGSGWRASLRLPVSRRAIDALQHPIGDVANWERIVANLAVLVDELDRMLASEIDAAVEPSPAWFEPSR